MDLTRSELNSCKLSFVLILNNSILRYLFLSAQNIVHTHLLTYRSRANQFRGNATIAINAKRDATKVIIICNTSSKLGGNHVLVDFVRIGNVKQLNNEISR